MSRYDQKYKPFCPNCRKLNNGVLDRVEGMPLKINKRSVDYTCSRCGYWWRSYAKFAQREIGRRRRKAREASMNNIINAGETVVEIMKSIESEGEKCQT